MSEDITPVRQQYLETKRQYPGAILFFRLGDFYETFDEDAEIVSRELDIVLTSRPVGKGMRVPLAGIPYHAVDNYLSRLIDKGYHVAIAEQVGDQPQKGIFPRKVIRVVTPGTIMESALLPGGGNNFLASIVLGDNQENRAGFSYADISTGEFATTEFETNDLAALRAEVTRLRPAEIIFPDNQKIDDTFQGHKTPWASWHFEPGKAHNSLITHFSVATLDGFGLKDKTLAIRAAGGIIQYIKETEPESLGLFTGIKVYSTSDFMILDPASRRNLELTATLSGERKGSLIDVLDKTITRMGLRLINQWISQPLLDIKKIKTRQNGVEFFFSRSMIRAELMTSLKKIGDLERLTNVVNSAHAKPGDLKEIERILSCLPAIDILIKTALAQSPDEEMTSVVPIIDACQDENALLQSALDDNCPATLQTIGIFKSGYSEELDSVIEASRHARDWINNLEIVERERTGIKNLKVGFNKVFGYYIEISRGQAQNAPQEYIRKQTLVNAERFITPEMKEYETLILNAEERIHEIETRLFHELCSSLAKSSSRLLKTARGIGELDVLAALAEVAATEGYVKPEVIDGCIMEICNGRHPVVEHNRKTERYIPNDVIFEKGEVIRVITGPNMSGKSTYLRQAALITLMAQIGSFVPASSAKIGVVDRIFTRIGAQDEIHAGQSTFMVEMIEAANILHHATPRSLLILDEIGRGTSTYDGVSIAWAVVEYIHNHPQLRAKTLFATHYHELTQLADLLPGVRNYNVAVSEADGTIVFLHRIVPGGADRSYGIHVAQLAGLPNPVIQRASEIMAELERTSGKAISVNPTIARQVALFPETNPLLDELRNLDINTLSPIEALNKLFEWQRNFSPKNKLPDN